MSFIVNKEWDKYKNEFNNLICNINNILSLLYDDKICANEIKTHCSLYRTSIYYLQNKINIFLKEMQDEYNKKYYSLNDLEYKLFDNYYKRYSKLYITSSDNIYNDYIMILIEEYKFIKKQHLYFKNQNEIISDKLNLLELIN